MIANITKKIFSGISRSNINKELIKRFILVDAQLNPVIDVRFLMAKNPGASNVTCNFWVNMPGFSISGEGAAKGHGYCKLSASFYFALKQAGITLSEPIDGVGEGAIKDAMEAVANALGADMTKFIIIE